MIFSERPILLIVLIVYGFSSLVQLFYYLYYYLPVGLFKHPDINQINEPVSVIICARNEQENLKNFLPLVLEQKYNDFEVIVVNDCSEDDSYDVLGEFLKKYQNLRVSNITKDPKFTHNKKFAQFIGIKAAKNELLLFTDADCHPESDRWLVSMVSHFKSKTDFVLGYGGYIAGKGLLNKYIRYDSMTIAVQYIGMALRRIPYMGVGRNLAYRKSVFFDNKGFSSHSHLASGDDDLFVNYNATGNNSSVEFRKDAHTRSVPSSGINDFFKQKKRHLTTAQYYKFRDKILLSAEPVTRMIFYVLFLVLLSTLFLWPLVLVVFGVRLIAQAVVLKLAQNKFNEPGLLFWCLIFDIISPLINSAIYITNFRQSPGKMRWN